jgi:hypothetical protein
MTNTPELFPNNELIIEQIASFTVGAAEILKKEVFSTIDPKQEYRFALVPRGSDMYTGMLKAGGYLLLNKAPSTLIFCYEQNEHPKDITLYTQGQWPILGKHFLSHHEIGKWKITSHLLSEIAHHAHYAKLICNPNHLLRFGIGKAVTKKTLEWLVSTLIDFPQTTTIVAITDLQQGNSFEQGKLYDEALVTAAFSGTPSSEVKKFPILYLFSILCKKGKRQADMVGYLNTGEYGGNLEKTTGYACLVA